MLLNDAMKLKNNPDYKPVVSAGGELLIILSSRTGAEGIWVDLVTPLGCWVNLM